MRICGCEKYGMFENPFSHRRTSLHRKGSWMYIKVWVSPSCSQSLMAREIRSRCRRRQSRRIKLHESPTCRLIVDSMVPFAHQRRLYHLEVVTNQTRDSQQCFLDAQQMATFSCHVAVLDKASALGDLSCTDEWAASYSAEAQSLKP